MHRGIGMQHEIQIAYHSEWAWAYYIIMMQVTLIFVW